MIKSSVELVIWLRMLSSYFHFNVLSINFRGSVLNYQRSRQDNSLLLKWFPQISKYTAWLILSLKTKPQICFLVGRHNLRDFHIYQKAFQLAIKRHLFLDLNFPKNLSKFTRFYSQRIKKSVNSDNHLEVYTLTAWSRNWLAS